MNNSNPSSLINILQKLLYLMIFEAILFLPAMGQEKPPKPISVTVNTLQHLNFGTIIPNGPSGGTVTVQSNGIRTSSGEIILPFVGTYCSPALFELTALRGTLITILTPPTILSGNHGGALNLTLGIPSTGSQFVVRSTTTEIFIGGTLTIQSLIANPAGFYSGTFTVTFNQN